MKQRVVLPLYAALIGLIGLAITTREVLHLLAPHPDTPWVMIALLTVGFFISEARTPVATSSGDGGANRFSFSGGFAFALVLVGPLAVPILAHLLTCLVQDLRRSAGWMRLSFNLGEHVVAFAALSGVFSLVSGHSSVGLASLSTRDLAGIIVGGVTFVLVQHVLMGLVLSLALSRPLRRVLAEDVVDTLTLYGMDIGIAAVSVPVLNYSPWLLPLLVLPVIVLYRTSKLRAEKEHESLHDVLTGLPNRAMLRSNLESALREAEAGNSSVAVFMIDLDRFKPINDTLGHPVGDLLLAEVAQRLAMATRGEDTVARVGGDEFAVIAPLPPDEDVTAAARLAQRIVDAVAEPYVLQGLHMEIGASIGVAVSPAHGTDPNELMSRADIALYVAKEERGRATVYDPSQEKQADDHLSMAEQLRSGMDQGELELEFHPVEELAAQEVQRWDVAVGWRHPERGLMTGEDFAAIAASSGMTVSVSLEVLRQVLPLLGRWADAGLSRSLSLTLSERHLAEKAFPKKLSDLLTAAAVSPDRLILSLPAGVYFQDSVSSARVLGALRAVGVGTAVTDYGRGDAALAPALTLEVDELCLDAALVARAGDSPGERVILKAMIELAHSQGMRTVAVGVERESTLELLHALGCGFASGPRVGPARLRTEIADPYTVSA